MKSGKVLEFPTGKAGNAAWGNALNPMASFSVK